MKKIFCLSLLNVCVFCCFGQDNPYAVFGYKPSIEFKKPKEDVYRVRNTDTKSKIILIEFDFEHHLLKLINAKDSVIQTVAITDEEFLRFVSPDPLTKKYPELTPYQFASNTPIQAIDLDGLEGVVIGGADVSNTGVSETTKKITSSIQDNLKAANVNIPVKSFNVTRADARKDDIRTTAVYKNALAFIKANYTPDKPLALYGYSYGGAVVDALQLDLFNSGYKVNTLVLIDANRGGRNEYRPMIMSNVKVAYDFYQDSYNLLGSKGFPAEKIFSKSPTILTNRDLSAIVPVQPGYIPDWSPILQKTNKHSNIDELTMPKAIQLMTNGLKSSL